ncbi:MAG TPA: GIY-YIG nuclease family protein [Candidatus Kryptonia bacterium]
MIESEDGHRYTGQTDDLNRRLSEHNSGITRSTKHGRNWKLLYSEEYETRSEAVWRERFLKSGVGRNYLANVISSFGSGKHTEQ